MYGCHWKAVPAYICAELLGGIAAALISWPLYGTGLELGRWVGSTHHTMVLETVLAVSVCGTLWQWSPLTVGSGQGHVLWIQKRFHPCFKPPIRQSLCLTEPLSPGVLVGASPLPVWAASFTCKADLSTLT